MSRLPSEWLCGGWLWRSQFVAESRPAADDLHTGSTSEPVRLTLSMKIARNVWIMTDWSQPPQVAVWLEDPTGSTVRTLFVTHRTGAGDWKGKAGCNVSLPYWVGRYNVETATSGPPTYQRPVADAITNPRRKRRWLSRHSCRPAASGGTSSKSTSPGTSTRRSPSASATDGPTKRATGNRRWSTADASRPSPASGARPS